MSSVRSRGDTHRDTVTNKLHFAVVDDGSMYGGAPSNSPFAPFDLSAKLVNTFVNGPTATSKPLTQDTVTKPFLIRNSLGQIHIHSLKGLFDSFLTLKLESLNFIIICFSITSQRSLEAAMRWQNVLVTAVPFLPILLVGDDVEQREETPVKNQTNFVTRQHAKKCASKLGAYGFCEYSTALNSGIIELFEQAVSFAIAASERALPQLSLLDKKTKCELRVAITDLYNNPGVDNYRREFYRLLKKNVSKKGKLMLVDLSALNISNDQLTFLLPFIFMTVKADIDLNLSYNALHKVPPPLLAYLPTIKNLSIESNQIHMLQSELAQLDNLQWKGNPLTLIPETFRNNYNNWNKMREYLQTIKQSTTLWSEVKLLFVGQEGVGKTTLLKCFKSDKHKTDTKQNLSTNGVDISRGVQLKANSTVRFNTWDLGGQEVFYPTHQFFLTSNCIYVLVFNLVEMTQSRIEYWMRQIRLLSNNSERAPIFLVGTHADDPMFHNNDLASQRLYELANSYPKGTYRGLQTIQAVSCKSGDGIDELKERIVQLATSETWCRPKISPSWALLHEHISRQRDMGIDRISWNQFSEWADDTGVNANELPLCTEFLMDVGTIVHFKDNNTKGKESTSSMNDLVILNPQWLSDLMAAIVTFRHSWAKNGLIKLADLQHVLVNYSPEIHEQLIALLEKFSVLYRSKSFPDCVIVPSLLSETLTENQQTIAEKIWPETCPTKMHQYGRIYRFPFLPIGFIEKIIVRILHAPLIQCHLLWRNGLLIQQDEQVCLIQYHSVNNQLDIFVREPHISDSLASKKRNLLIHQITDAIDTLNECFYRGLNNTVDVVVPCSACLEIGIFPETQHSFPYAQLIEVITTGQQSSLVCSYSSSKKLKRNSKQAKPNSKAAVTTLSVYWLAPDVAFSDLTIIEAKEIQISTKIAEGGFGCIFLGDYNGVPVAVKELLPVSDVDDSSSSSSSSTAARFKEFQQEAFVMSCLQHPNLVKLFGICVSPTLRMILELIPFGDLFNYLHVKVGNGDRVTIRAKDFSWRLRLKMALDVAKGMEYLEKFSPPIVHRDLRSPNLFVVSLNWSDPVCLKVGDFGLSRIAAPHMAGALATWQWLAPEVFNANDADRYDESSDRFSFAICCWEIATRQMPYEEFENHPKYSTKLQNGKRVVNPLTLKTAITEGLRPSFPPSEGVPKGFIDIIESCWHANPKERPSFAVVVKQLTELIDSDPKKYGDGKDAGSSLVQGKKKKGLFEMNSNSAPIERKKEIIVPKLSTPNHHPLSSSSSDHTSNGGNNTGSGISDDPAGMLSPRTQRRFGKLRNFLRTSKSSDPSIPSSK